jgi:chitodextrinase
MRPRALQRLIYAVIAATTLALGVPAQAQTSGLKVQCHFQAGTTSNQIYTAINVINGGTTTVALSDLTIRYWYTEDGTQAQTYWCDYTPRGCANVTSKFVKLTTTFPTADTYFELGFTSGASSLTAGQSTGDIQSRVAKNDWSNFNLANDYSYSGNTAAADCPNVTLYQAGVRVWGNEPSGTADTTAPTAPTGLTAGAVTSSSVTLSWTASTDNVGVTGYDVYNGTALAASVTTTSASVSGLAANTSYSFTVKAKDAAGNVSAASTALSVKTAAAADTTAPTAPTGLTASAVTSSSVTLSWTASTDNVGVTGYDVYNGTALAASVATTSASLSGLTANTSYSFTVKAKDAAGNVSAASTALSVKTAAAADTTAPTAPTGLTSSAVTSSSVTLSWTASTDNVGVTGYDVYNGATLAASVATTSVSVSGLAANTSYSFTVKAKDAAGNVSAASTALSVKTSAAADTTAPTAPTGLTASAVTSSSVTLSWTASTDNVAVTGYDVYQGTALAASVATTSVNVSGLAASTAYSFTVKAKDAAGNVSAASAALSVTTQSSGGGTATLKVQYYPAGAAASTNQLTPVIDIVNTGTTTVTMSELTVRYWYTKDGANSQVYSCDYTPRGCGTLTTRFVNITPVTGADNYLEIGFTSAAGTLAPGQSFGAIQNRFAKSDYSSLTQTNDYSFDATKTSLTDWSHITLYRNGSPVWGTDPMGTGPGLDTTPPTAPTSLASPYQSSSSISLAWKASTDAIGVTRYDVYSGTTLLGSSASATYTATGLLASTAYTFSVKAWDAAGNVSAASSALTVTTLPAGTDALVSVDTSVNRRAISPYVYGSNASKVADAPPGATLLRLGGNRWTAYNWANNWSNAGSDYGPYSNDTFFGSASNPPAYPIYPTIDEAKANGLAALVTIPIQGYVSQAKSGNVNPVTDAVTSWFVPNLPAKGSAFTLTPDPASATVYQDELANYIAQRWGTAGTAHLSLDNEPDLWGYIDSSGKPTATHPEVQRTQTGYADMLKKTIASATAIKAAVPTSLIYGPASYGWAGFLSFQGAPDAPADQGVANMFLDYYMTNLNSASTTAGKRLLDVLDVHWYPEAQSHDCVSGTGGVRITSDASDDCLVAARVQAPRSLFDPGFVETSWITQWTTNYGPIQLLPLLQGKIAKDYPGTKLAITEYNYGGENHISGAVAQADVLGIFGREGLYSGALWPLSSTHPWTFTAWRAYRNYDGAGHHFGDTSVSASTSDLDHVSTYASVDASSAARMVLVVVHRPTLDSTGKLDLKARTVTIQWKHSQALATARAWQLAPGTSAVWQALTAPKVSSSSVTITLPALSVTTIELTP